jgi:hypothetical protein
VYRIEHNPLIPLGCSIGGLSKLLDLESRLFSFQSFLKFPCLGWFEGLYTVLEESWDELIALDAIKLCRGQLFFIAMFDLAIHRICLYRFDTLAILNIYNIAACLPFSFHKDTMDLLAVIAKMVHFLFVVYKIDF